jgi:DNA repair protein RadC
MNINLCRTKLTLVKDTQVNYEVKDFQIQSPSDVADLLYNIFHLQGEMQEHFMIILLDTKNKIIGARTLFTGTLNKSLVHPRDIFATALVSSACSVILAHNHPSGDTTPSISDINITKRIVAGGEMLGIDVLDHVIIGSNLDEDYSYLSMREQKYI